MLKLSKIKKAAKCIDSILTIYDFNSRVILNLDDGSRFELNNAFYIKLAEYVVIFTEHHGVFIKLQEKVISVRQYTWK